MNSIPLRYTESTMSFISQRKKNDNPNLIRQGILIGVCILAIVWLGSLIVGLFSKAQIAWNTAQHTQSEAQVLKHRENILEQNMHTLDTSRGYSASVRTVFGVARKDESVIIVVPPTIATSTSVQKSWWRSILAKLHL